MKYVDWNEESIVHTFDEKICGFCVVKVTKPHLARWLRHIAVSLRVRNQKTIPIAPDRIFVL